MANVTFSDKPLTVDGVKIHPKWNWSSTYRADFKAHRAKPRDTKADQADRANKYLAWQRSKRTEVIALDSIVADLSNDLRDQVAKIEADVETSRGHYGDYLNIMLVTANGDKSVAKILSLALIRAGANQRGVSDALRQFGG